MRRALDSTLGILEASWALLASLQPRQTLDFGFALRFATIGLEWSGSSTGLVCVGIDTSVFALRLETDEFEWIGSSGRRAHRGLGERVFI